jgi:hypothetical protein
MSHKNGTTEVFWGPHRPLTCGILCASVPSVAFCTIPGRGSTLFLVSRLLLGEQQRANSHGSRNRQSGSMSGMWQRNMAGLLRHRHTKGTVNG